MLNLKAEIVRLLQNEKMTDFFETSDGQGMIQANIERNFSFKELLDLKEKIISPETQRFLANHENFPNLINFFKFLEKRVDEIVNIYTDAATPEYIIKTVQENQDLIIKKFPTLNRVQSFTKFANLYQEKHKELSHHSYIQAKDFFSNPVSWIL